MPLPLVQTRAQGPSDALMSAYLSDDAEAFFAMAAVLYPEPFDDEAEPTHLTELGDLLGEMGLRS